MSRLRTGKLNNLEGSGAQGLCLVVWHLALGDQGQWVSGPSVGANRIRKWALNWLVCI